MACGLVLLKRASRPQLGLDTAELELECFRFPHRHSGPQLLPSGSGNLEEVVERAFGDPDIDGTVQQRKQLRHGLIERSREARRAVLEVEEICCRGEDVVQDDMMTAAALEAGNVPGVLDLPV